MPTTTLLSLPEIEAELCALVEQSPYAWTKPLTRTSTLQDCGLADSLDVSEFFIAIENRFGATIPNVHSAPNAVFKAVFTRAPLRIADLAELIYLQQGTADPRHRTIMVRGKPVSRAEHPFTQLNGVWHREMGQALLEPLDGAYRSFRRRSDGMRCVQISAATVEIGCDAPEAHPDEGPPHTVDLDTFLIDAEPVSTTAYCRFLNTIGLVDQAVLRDWFLLDADDHRNEHVLIGKDSGEWRPVPGVERWPLVLVSWYGANAYSLWANGRAWVNYRDEDGDSCCLPSEAQWEYAARGRRFRRFPWGNDDPDSSRMQYGEHAPGETYQVATMKLADVNVPLGMSPFGLHHMAGNVWQWCRDWYADTFYQRGDAEERNPVNRWPTGVRSERGGSWVGPADLCRSSHRRGRPPLMRGRCLGFRCVGATP